MSMPLRADAQHTTHSVPLRQIRRGRSVLLSECRANAALASLPPEALDVILPHIKVRHVAAGDVLWAHAPAERVWFPLSGIVAVSWLAPNGREIEVAKAGCEAFAGLDKGPISGVVLLGGAFASIDAAMLAAAAGRHASIAGMIEACRDWQLVQARQLVACNALHFFTSRLARWLLEVSWRGDGDIRATQEMIADGLGVLRSQVTQSAGCLRADGAIAYRRSRIWIMDHGKLAGTACDCAASLGPAHWPFGAPAHG